MIGLLQQWVTEQAERRPEAPAIFAPEDVVTYGELEERSNRLARALKECGCTPGDRVCFALPKSPAAIVGILAILKADGAYVPIDPASPAARAASIIRSCEPRALLMGRATSGLVTTLAEDGVLGTAVRIGWMDEGYAPAEGPRVDFTVADARACRADPRDYSNTADAPAYIFYTSGSTGTPKGVAITHSNVIHFVRWATKYFGIGPSDRLSGHAPLHFDLSVLDLFGTFAAGAQLHPVPRMMNLLPRTLADWIRASELTQWFSVPSVLSYLASFDAVRHDDFPSLERVLWCGEVLPTPALIYWMERLPGVAFTNLYGPTETTVASSYYTVPECPRDERAEIPIGRPCEGEELLILDRELRAVAPGETADLYIRGVGLGMGYWKDEAKTSAAFVRDPFSADPSARLYRTGDLARLDEDGLVYFAGREDSQIKSRGYRIELREIEIGLSAIRLIRECAVVGIDSDGFDGTAIACAYASRPGVEATPRRLRGELVKVLPDYMLPTRWLRVERLPRNVNGKIDRGKVKELLEKSCT